MAIRRAHFLTLILASAIALVVGTSALASVHATYNVLPDFTADGFSASWLQSASDGLTNGSAGNGAVLTGQTSSRIAGSLEGDLSGNVLSNVSGNITGSLKQLAGYFNGVFGTSFTTSTPFALELGLASGGNGALAFETNGAGTGQYTGGYLDFSLFVDGAATSLLDGTFFFKPQAESGSDTLSPNRGTSSEFTLWGWNWMHDGSPVNGAAEPNWGTFLSGLDYSGQTILRTPASGPGLQSPFGVALYVVDPDPPAIESLHNPEPTGLIVWGILAAIGVGVFRPQRFAFCRIKS